MDRPGSVEVFRYDKRSYQIDYDEERCTRYFPIKACVAYKVNGEEIDYFPYDITEGVEPVYAELPGWQTDMTKMQSEDEFPEEFNAYLTFLEEQLGVEIKIVSVGPDRAQTIERYTEE